MEHGRSSPNDNKRAFIYSYSNIVESNFAYQIMGKESDKRYLMLWFHVVIGSSDATSPVVDELNARVAIPAASAGRFWNAFDFVVVVAIRHGLLLCFTTFASSLLRRCRSVVLQLFASSMGLSQGANVKTKIHIQDEANVCKHKHHVTNKCITSKRH